MQFGIRRSAIFEVWRSSPKTERFNVAYTFVLNHYKSPDDLSEDLIKSVKVTVRSLCQQIELKWQKSNRKSDRFLETNSEWLEGSVYFPETANEPLPSTSADPSTSRGRPVKPFLECSEKTKHRKVKSSILNKSVDEIALGAELKAHSEGKRHSAKIIKELLQASPERGTIIKKARLAYAENKQTISVDRALSMIVDAHLSTHQYEIIRKQANEVHAHLYPSYYSIKQAKQRCYPDKISVTETKVDIQLQALVDHTVQRLCLTLEERCRDLPCYEDLHIIMKWGCDGAQQSRHKQKFRNAEDSDGNLFSFSMVPIQLYQMVENRKDIIWKNPSPSSTRYCRPIKFMFAKESTELISAEVSETQRQIDLLSPTCVSFNGKLAKINPTLVLSMIDGKVCSALSVYSSSQACFLCGATPKNMNNKYSTAQTTIDENALTFGLSPLHAWIRFMECILHIGYRLPLKVWQVKGSENKEIVMERKKVIQDRFKAETGLLVDIPTQQAGNTNDGNTARRFFKNAAKSADITGVNVELIRRFHVILEAINCGYPINPEAFGKYADETLDLYLKHYSWYYIPSTVHKVLCHGTEVISSCILPIGQLSEEAQEARNKDNRKFRELFTRKTSRIHTNTDLVHRLLISSDPFIASLRHIPKTSKGRLPKGVLPLLFTPETEGTDDDCKDYVESDNEFENESSESDFCTDIDSE